MSTLTAPDETMTVAQRRTEPAPIPMTRIIGIELTKMFDTRSGFWLMCGVGLAALIATAATVVFAPRSELTYESFATAIGAPLAVLLPVVAILAVTSEWSQRTGLTTFTLVPHRGRVIGAKAIAILGVAVVSMLVAAVVGAGGNLVGTAIAGVDPVWNVSLVEFSHIVLANVLGMGMGFMLAILIRNSAGAIVGYFAYTALLPAISSALASTQGWYRDNGPWLDFGFASSRLYDATMTAHEWAQLGVSGLLWLVLPLSIGLWLTSRSEVK